MIINNVNIVLYIILIFQIIKFTYIVFSNKKNIIYKEFIILLLIIYIILLYKIVTFKDINYKVNNYKPFKEILRYKVSSRLFIKNVLGNIIMFMPFGMFVCYFIFKYKFIITFILSFIVSFLIENIQIIIGRTFDIDDIILNVMGGIFGYFIYRIINIFVRN